MADNYTERFIRWQAIAIDQRGKTINLILSLSLATIAFICSQILDKDFHFENCCAKFFIVFGSILLFFCVIVSLWLNLNRLKDFDETKDIIKARSQNTSAIDIAKLENINKTTGKLTKCWFTASIWIFGIGELIIIFGLISQILKKL